MSLGPMDEILTQREVDSILLAGGRSATASPALDVQPYDFARPPRVSRDRRAALEAVHGRFAATLQAVLASSVRMPVDLSLAEVEQTTFGEFTMSIPSPCVVFPLRLGERVAGQGILEFDRRLAYFLVERLFGGPGDGGAPHRPLTAFEQSIVRSVAERFLMPLREAWHPRVALAPELLAFEANPEMLHGTPREETVLVSHLAVRAGEFVAGFTLGLPVHAIEPGLRGRTAPAPRRPTDAGSDPGRGLIASGLQQALVRVAARLPLVSLRARDVAALHVGQVIETGHAIDAPVEVHVNGNLRFLGSLGQLRRHIGLRISSPAAPSAAQRPARGRWGRVS